MKKLNDYLDGLDITEGMQHRSNCPVCAGRNTFTATKDDGLIIYNCYKLGCGARGYLSVGLTFEELKRRLKAVNYEEQQAKPLEPMVWPEYVVDPSPAHPMLKRFADRWDLDMRDMMYDVKDRRAVFPIRHKGVLIDAAGRALDGAIPKWYRYTSNADVYAHTVGKKQGVAVIVEDIISAITVAKLCPGTTGLAILGTSLSAKHMEYLEDYYKVIVALDPDAAHKTLQFKREIEAWTGISTTALRLTDDLKYKIMTDVEQLKELI
jgi:hypothetical protein